MDVAFIVIVDTVVKISCKIVKATGFDKEIDYD